MSDLKYGMATVRVNGVPVQVFTVQVEEPKPNKKAKGTKKSK